MKSPILAVCVPCLDTWSTFTAFDMTAMFAELWEHPIKPFELEGNLRPRLIIHQSSVLPLSREILVMKALELGAEWVLFLDSDMRFPADLVHFLLSHKVDIVSCQYAKKSGPKQPVIDYDPEAGELKGLVNTQAIATGCCLIRADVFRRIPRPWFAFVSGVEEHRPGDPTSTVLGEDIYFSRKAMACGYRLYVDFNLSKHIGHVGPVQFYLDGPRWAKDMK